LCRDYWHPLFLFVRSLGYGFEEAKDLIQEFFFRVVEKHYFDQVDKAKGRFRSYLLAAVKNFLANEWDKSHTIKRGRNIIHIPVDELLVAGDMHNYVKTDPELLYQRAWVNTLLERVLERLRIERTALGKEDQYNYLKFSLTADYEKIAYKEVAMKLSMTEGAVKTAVHRLRRRFQHLLREELNRLVADSKDIDDELNFLISIFT